MKCILCGEPIFLNQPVTEIQIRIGDLPEDGPIGLILKLCGVSDYKPIKVHKKCAEKKGIIEE